MKLIIYASGSQPFVACVPPNRTQTPLRTPNSDSKPSAYPQNKFVHFPYIFIPI